MSQSCHISWARFYLDLANLRAFCPKIFSQDQCVYIDMIPQTVNLLSIFVISFDGRGHVQSIFAIQVLIVRTPQLSTIPSNDINLTPGLTYQLSVFWWLPSQTPAVLAMISPWGAGTSVSVSRHAYQRTISSHCVVCFVSFCRILEQ